MTSEYSNSFYPSEYGTSLSVMSEESNSLSVMSEEGSSLSVMPEYHKRLSKTFLLLTEESIIAFNRK